MAVETDRRAIEEFLVNILLPQIAGLHHMHVGIHCFESVLHGVLLAYSD